MPTGGGISRITANLTTLFRNNNINVFYIGARKTKEYDYDKEQYFLPEKELVNQNNVQFICDFIYKHNISTIINQGALSPLTHKFLAEVKTQTNVKIISCIHNPILTPINNYAYQREYFLRKHHLTILYNVLKWPITKSFFKLLYKWKHRGLYKLMYRTSDKIVGLSNGMKSDFEEIIDIKNLNNFIVIPNFFEKPNDNQLPKEKLILWVGSLNIPVKRIDFMLKAWKEIGSNYPDWTLLILGNGKDLDESIQLSKRYKLTNCKFLGRVDPTEYYQKASILCVTSSYEGFPLVLLEALNFEVVPLALNSFSTASEILDNGKYGVLAEPFNIDDFCSKLKSLIADESLRIKFKQNSGDALKRYSADSILSDWKKIL